MPRQPDFARCVFLPYRSRHDVPADAEVIDVSSYADPPYCTLSPMWPHGGIPIPGLPGQASDSVEGIWQGLTPGRGILETALDLFAQGCRNALQGAQGRVGVLAVLQAAFS